MIPSTLPQITSSNWRSLHEQGWRFARNLSSYRYRREPVIKALQEQYGVSRVTLGEHWSFEHHGPVKHPTKDAVYIKDVDDLVEAVRKDIQAFEKYDERYDN